MLSFWAGGISSFPLCAREYRLLRRLMSVFSMSGFSMSAFSMSAFSMSALSMSTFSMSACPCPRVRVRVFQVTEIDGVIQKFQLYKGCKPDGIIGVI